MSTLPTTSVALCTFNGAAFIEEQLWSILNQTVPVGEIIIADDGSSDSTLDIARKMLGASDAVAGAPGVKFLTGPRLGITRNFERATKACSGQIIFLSDQDDVWEPAKVEQILSQFTQSAETFLVFTDARLVDASGSDLGVTQFEKVRMSPQLLTDLCSERAFQALLHRNVVTGATIAFRSGLLDIALPFSNRWLHDEWLAILAAAAGPLAAIEAPLVLYRQHAANHCGMRHQGVVEILAEMVSTPLQDRIANDWISRWENLSVRLRRHSGRVHAASLEQAERALLFQRERGALRGSRLARVWDVFALAAQGGYSRYADGWRSIAKDILAK